MTQTIVAIVSGGLDSVTMAHACAHTGYDVRLLSFDYGQRHAKELEFARLCAERLDARHDVVDLTGLAPLIATSALTGEVAVPDGHYAQDTMRSTVVPNRNMTMLSIACAVAVAEGAHAIGFGAHGGDHFIYPDCRPEFVHAAQKTLRLATEGFRTDDLRIVAPFLHSTKADIVALGANLGVPFELTWSCYKGGPLHCGACGTCFERREAFSHAGVDDPTVYEATPSYADPR